MKTLIYCVTIIFFLFPQIFSSQTGSINYGKNKLTLKDRIEGMFLASAIADAMAGPHEGRRTEVSQKFLEDGGWIDSFKSYTPWFQHHWNVFQREAPAGTFTDDTRFRLLSAKAMIKNENKNPGQKMSKHFFASFIFFQYQEAFNLFRDQWKFYKLIDKEKDKTTLDQKCKENFLQLWFLWEICKTATEVFIPNNPTIYYPPAKRIAHSEYTDQYWQLEEVKSRKVESNIKSSFHLNCYERGEEMPLGLIALLPLSIYFPGEPKLAFKYILEMDFFDIKDADLYPAVVGAMLADLLGGKNWDKIISTILNDGLKNYLACDNRPGLDRLQTDVEKAISISRSFKTREEPYSRKNYINFIKVLHKNFAVGEVMMCTVDEMFSVSVAIMDYAPANIKQVIEMSVNYGRDNDTVASIISSFAGALLGSSTIPEKWKKTLFQSNRYVKFQAVFDSLVSLSGSDN